MKTCSWIVLGAVASACARCADDGAPYGPRLTQPPWWAPWNEGSVRDGRHELGVRAWNRLGQQSDSPSSALDVTNLRHSPRLRFSTDLGGREVDSARDVFIDAQGCVYVTGGTASSDFPTTPGAYDRTFHGIHDAYVAKFAPDGRTLIFSTYLGGPNYDRGYALEVDEAGGVYVAGRAGDGLPTTPGVVQENFAGDDHPSGLYGPQDGFVAKLSPDGSALEWCTYFGDAGPEALRDIALDAAGNVYVAREVDRPHWAITAGAFDTTFDGPTDGMVAELSADGTEVVWASYFGGSGADGGTPSIRAAADGRVWILGHSTSDDFPATPGAYQTVRGGGADLVVLRVAPGGGTLEWASYFGGSGVEFSETHGLAVGTDGVVTIAATTLSTDLPYEGQPAAPGFQTTYGGSGGRGSGAGTNDPGDGFVAKLSADGSRLLAFTYFGGSLGEGVEGVATDFDGSVLVTGGSFSNDLPVTANAFQPARAGGADAFLARFSSDLSTLEFGTYFGGGGDDFGRALALAPDGTVTGAGATGSDDFPTRHAFDPTFGGGASDGYALTLGE